jgi:hypothetical protein
MALVHGPAIAAKSYGTSTNPTTLHVAGNMARSYAKAKHSTGDVRISYEDMKFSGVGGGDMYRWRAIADTTDCATTATINCAHLTARVPSGKTISGAMNALRLTLETATTTPGGTLSALQLDSNLVGSSLHPTTAAFIRVTQSGSTNLNRFMNVPAPVSADSTSLFVASADKAATHMLRFVSDAGVTYWLLATTNTPS